MMHLSYLSLGQGIVVYMEWSQFNHKSHKSHNTQVSPK